MTTKNDQSFQAWKQKRHGKQTEDEKPFASTTRQTKEQTSYAQQQTYNSLKQDISEPDFQFHMESSSSRLVSDRALRTPQFVASFLFRSPFVKLYFKKLEIFPNLMQQHHQLLHIIHKQRLP